MSTQHTLSETLREIGNALQTTNPLRGRQLVILSSHAWHLEIIGSTTAETAAERDRLREAVTELEGRLSNAMLRLHVLTVHELTA